MENDDDYRTADSGDEESLSYSAGDDDYLPEDEQVDDFGESRCPQENYILLKEEEIAKLQQDYISEVSTVLSISKSDACLLLPHFHWSVEDLQDEWFADEDKVRDKAGLLKKPIVEHNASQNLTTSCEICFEEYYYSLDASSRSNSILTASCGHPYCRDCWAGYISTSIGEGGPACLMLRCPQPKCSAAVGHDLIQKVLLTTNHGTAYDKYKRYQLRSYVENHRKIKWCPAPNCDYAIQFDAHVGMGSCDVSCLCSHSYCWNCTEENHSPVDCETVAKWILKNKDDSQNAHWILVHSKPCPRCKKPIEKNQGCNHMRCRCGQQFCWSCLGPLYGGCNCNKYRSSGTGMSAVESQKKKAKMYLERYLHYFERWDNNGKSKQKALEDFDKVKNVHIHELGKIQGNTKEHEYNFIIEAWQQIIECRQVLRWTYAYGYYMSDDEPRKRQLFEILQGHAEFSLERLHKCAESELQQFLVCGDNNDHLLKIYGDFRKRLINLTKVTGTYFKKLASALEEGLPETYDEASWTCDQCTYINVGTAITCDVCNMERNSWCCALCTYRNPASAMSCEMCSYARVIDAHHPGQGGEIEGE